MISAIFGIIGVVVGSFLSTLKDAYFSSRVRRKQAEYAAIRIVCLLDEYVDRCLDVVRDDGTSEGRPAGRTEQGEDYCDAQVRLPDPPAYPDDIDWKSLRTSLMYRALSLPSRAHDRNRFIAASSDHAFPPDFSEYFEARQEGYARLGLEAHKLAVDLRKTYRVPELYGEASNPAWNPSETLNATIREIDARKLSRSNSSMSIFADSEELQSAAS